MKPDEFLVGQQFDRASKRGSRWIRLRTKMLHLAFRHFALEQFSLAVRFRHGGSRSRHTLRPILPIIICDIYIISFSKGSIYRRGARRWKKMYYVNGHTFQARRFNRVSIISCNYHCTISVHLPWSRSSSLLSPAFAHLLLRSTRE